MNLRQLRYFVEVADQQSVTRAASRLRIAQPALTRHLRGLERTFGVRLFARSGRGIALTPAGARFHERLKPILDELSRAQQELRAAAAVPVHHVRLGVPTCLSSIVAGKVIERFSPDRSWISVEVIDGWSGFVLDWLLQGKLDLAILYDNTVETGDVVVRPLATEMHFLVCRPSDPLARRRDIRLDEIASLPLVLPTTKHGLRRAVDGAFRSIGCRPAIALEVDSSTMIKDIVARRPHYSILSQSEVQDLGRSLAAVAITAPPLLRSVDLAWRVEGLHVPATAEVVGVIRSEIEALVRSGVWGQDCLARSWHLGAVEADAPASAT